MCNLLPCELSQRIRGFSTTMRYINRHYLSIYLSKTSFTLLPIAVSATVAERHVRVEGNWTRRKQWHVFALWTACRVFWWYVERSRIFAHLVRWLFDSLYPCGTWWMEQLIIVVGAMIRLQVFALCVGRKTYTQQLKRWRDTSKSGEVRWR